MFIAFNMGWIIFWGIAYVLIVRRGFIDKTFGYPFIAICVDIAWVTTFTLIYPQSPFMLLFVIVDLIFLYQLLKFRTSDLTNLSKTQYYAAVVLAIVTSFALIIAFSIEFDDVHGVYSSFVDTLLTSILFIVLILRRDNVKGQSIYIAISKMLGTLSAVIAYNFFTFPNIRPRMAIHIFHEVLNIPLELSPTPVPSYIGSTLLAVLGISIFIYDIIYIVLVYKKSKEQGINPWRRV
jgi:hypothetical protein